MKAIINGLRYDTDKAIRVGNARFSEPGDWKHWDEDLYITPRSKRFFLDGSGGPMSRYAVKVSNTGWSGGRRIVPLSREEALEWMQDNGLTDQIEHWFADAIEDA
jgi:hypothetical protein